MEILPRFDRRRLLTGAANLLLLGGSDPVSRRPWPTRILDSAAMLNQWTQALVTPPGAHGRLYTRVDISKHFKSNGTHDPSDAEYRALAAREFVDWRLEVGGLVDRPMDLSLARIRALPAVTQITRHDCVEGWSCIGEWTGVPLGTILHLVGVRPGARYVMFFCYDTLPGAKEKYYESIDIAEAFYPETILAYGMNGRTLPIPYGAPLRLRLGRQLGYKMAKYLRRIELVASFRPFEGGHGGFYEDNGYAWYAGI